MGVNRDYKGWFTVEQAWEMIRRNGGMSARKEYYIFHEDKVFMLALVISFD